MTEPDDPHFTDDGRTLSFHCDDRAQVVMSSALVRKFVDEINRLRRVADGVCKDAPVNYQQPEA